MGTSNIEPPCSEVSGYELRRMRSLVFHLLYAVDAFEYDCSLESVIDNFNRGFDLSISTQGKVAWIAQEVIEHRKIVDHLIIPFLANWRFERLGCCTRLILRYAAWELLYTDMPSNIVINEAIELAKCFSEKDAYRFVNGILDEIYKNTEKLRKELDITSILEVEGLKTIE